MTQPRLILDRDLIVDNFAGGGGASTGIDYAIVDIGMRMLTPRELYRAQGFPADYIIDFTHHGKPLTKTAQVRMCGNSVCPPVATALVNANIQRTIKAARKAA